MINQINLSMFNELYDETYNDVLKYVVCRCSNINDVNDIIQETYLELYKILNKKKLENTNVKAFIKGIANNKIKKHYSLLYKIQTLSIFSTNEKDISFIETIKDDFDLEKLIIDQELFFEAWNYVKNKKLIIVKIFFLYYSQDLTIKEIASDLGLSESFVKNSLYRTLKELKNNFGKDSD